MRFNPALRDLGFASDDRVVVVHADDVGMCEATVGAYFDLAADGLTSAGSVMVPCPSFPEVAAGVRDRDGDAGIDLGVHLTLTSEWDGYRWGPIATHDQRSGLLDDDGCFHRSPQRWTTVDPDAARLEMGAQVDRASAAGIDVTHVDCHMFAMLHADLIEHYIEVGLARGLPVLLTRQPQWVDALSEAALDGWEEQGLPVFDHLREMPHDQPTAQWPDITTSLFDALPAGLTYLVTHPAADTPELRAVAGDWGQRVADYRTFASAEVREHVRRTGVHVIGWRPLRDLLRERCVSA